MDRSVLLAVVAGLSALAAAGPALAGRAIYSYDSVTPVTVSMTESGITLVLDKSFASVRVKSVLETEDMGQADLKPASQGDLGPGGLPAVVGADAHERDLYEILPEHDGKALVGALCPGAARAWLAFGRIGLGRDLRVRAIGRDPGAGQARLCRTLDYAFHGEWRAPQTDLPQPDRTDPFNDAPANRRF
jgi:hypothetical protein